MFLYVIPLFLSTFLLVSSDEVPISLWNIKGNALQLKPVPALGNADNLFIDSVADILQNKAKILVFSVNKVSLEDFSSPDTKTNSNNTLLNVEKFLNKQPFMFMPSVKDALNHMHNAKCGMQEFIVDEVVDDNVLKSVGEAFKKSCIVVLHINDYSITKTADPNYEELKKVFSPTFAKLSNDIVGLFTSVKSSWNNYVVSRRMSRSLFATEEPDQYFINITGCLIAYAKNGSLLISNTTALQFPADTSGSKCTNETSILKLTFKPSSDITELVLTLNFTKKKNSWTTEATAEMSGPKAPQDIVQFNADEITAAQGFSFSCGKLELKYGNKSEKVTITIDSFQVQPFDVKEAFSDSFDCVPYFTIPIWMGVFVSLLFIAIINCGVYALFSVNTMDRFDDPKGKTISVAASAE